MYIQHFNLSEPPFSIAPNPRYLYLSAQHREALAHLLYGIGVGGGFVALTGEVGTGKTTLCRCLLEQLPEDVDIALIFNPRLNSRELLASLCDELRIAYPGSKASLKQLIDVLNHHLLDAHARGRRTIALIDEAQNLSFEVLEQIRLLTNLETNQAKLLQIILVGQPELNHLLERPNLRQLSQRITARYHLHPLSIRETEDYIRHRLAVSGARDPIFSRAAVGEIYRRSGGIPRLINVICDRALLGAYTLGRTKVGWPIARKAARELRPAGGTQRVLRLAVAAAMALVLMAGLVYFDVLPRPDAGLIPRSLAAWLEKPGTGSHPEPKRPIREKPVQNTAIAKSQPEAPRETAPSSTPPKPTETAVPASGSGTAIPQTGQLPLAEPKLAATPEPAAPFAQRVADSGLNRSTAFARLLALWKLEPPADTTDACAFAGQHGLRCLSVHGSWFQLRSLNHPAVLEFALPSGGKRYATLIRLLDDKIELNLGERTQVFALAEILPFWTGDFVLLWKPPDGNAKAIGPGERGETIKWVRAQLRVPAAPDEEDYFDPGLKARVVAFQAEQGLIPDGVVGPYTLIYLGMNANDLAVPRLATVSR
jgi:general secretion pathway protein A